VLGASDNVGSLSVNQALSIARAQNTADALVALGIDKTQVMTSGLGIIEDAPPNTNVRKAIIHVIINNK
jgi:outer membrane protein OmpA-like peptidoglycan-associated protein